MARHRAPPRTSTGDHAVDRVVEGLRSAVVELQKATPRIIEVELPDATTVRTLHKMGRPVQVFVGPVYREDLVTTNAGRVQLLAHNDEYFDLIADFYGVTVTVQVLVL